MRRFIIHILSLLAISFMMVSFLPSAGVTPSLNGLTSDSYADFDTIKTNLDGYIWPTDASLRVTSSFAEFRSTHFHGGIDISTNGKTGYDVYAVRDGYVSRIYIAPNGYGKMLYVTHPDGYTSTYAHLKGFNSLINGIAREEQYRKGTFAIDLKLHPGRIRVKQGDVIAFTGETGVGPPHLHFELRDENLNPVNPLLLTNFRIDDAIPPSINRIMISPLDPLSTVDNGTQPKIFSRFNGNMRTMRIPQTIRTHGLIGFSVDAIDRSNGVWSRAGVHQMDFYVDDALLYTMALDRVPANESKQILLHYDLAQLRSGRGRFQKLYVEPGNSLPFYKRRQPGTGIINTDQLSEGEHDFRIVCRDNRGNATELYGTLFANHRPAIEIADLTDSEIQVTGKDIGMVSRFLVYGKRNYDRSWKQHTLPQNRVERTTERVILPVSSKQYDVIKVVGETRHGSLSDPVFYFKRKPAGGVAHKVLIDADAIGNTIRIQLSSAGSFTEKPVVTIHEGQRRQMIDMAAVDVSKYVGIFFPADDFIGERQVIVDTEINGKDSHTEGTFELFSIPTNRSGFFSTGKEGLMVFYDSAAVFSPLHMRIQTEPLRNSTLYTLEPQNVLLNRGVKFSVPYNPDQYTEKLGLYYRGNGGWILESSKPDNGRETFSTTVTRTLGELALMTDDVQPSIGRLSIQPRRGRPYISFSYSDNLSGVDLDALRMYINDRLIIPEIDGERRKVWLDSEETFARGRHTMKITLKDRMGNETTIDRTFAVK